MVCGFAFGAVLQFVVNAARRAAGPGKAWTAGLRRALFGSRTRSAAYLAHVGMVLIVAGLLGSTVYKAESTALVATKPGSEDAVLATDDGKYTLEFTGTRSEPGEQQSERTYAAFDVFTDGGSTKIGTVEPRTDIYPVSGAAVRAVILGRPFEDVFVVADEPFDGSSEAIALRVVVFPLIRWVWIGSILLCVGAVVSLWPRMRPQEALADDAAAELAARGRASEASA